MSDASIFSAPEALGYPLHPERIPPFDVSEGRYRCRFAQSAAELRSLMRLRYEVFNLELGEGLEESHATGLDRDVYDGQCHHLLVEEISGGTMVGTYRLQVREMARAGEGFYSAQEFDLSGWFPEVVEASVEIGRACIAREHRHRRVLLLLWKGLGAYALHNQKRFFFGCCSLTSQDPDEAARVTRWLREHGHQHDGLPTRPQPGFECGPGESEGWEGVGLPTLFRTYLRYGARICGAPAMDRQFKTIDYLALVDLGALDPEAILRQFEVDLRDRT